MIDGCHTPLMPRSIKIVDNGIIRCSNNPRFTGKDSLIIVISSFSYTAPVRALKHSGLEKWCPMAVFVSLFSVLRS